MAAASSISSHRTTLRCKGTSVGLAADSSAAWLGARTPGEHKATWSGGYCPPSSSGKGLGTFWVVVLLGSLLLFLTNRSAQFPEQGPLAHLEGGRCGSGP